jgi:hypothetical protein
MSHQIDRRRALRTLGALGLGGVLVPASALLGTPWPQDGPANGQGDAKAKDKAAAPRGQGGRAAAEGCAIALSQWSMRRTLLRGKLDGEGFDTAAFVARARGRFGVDAVELSSLLLETEFRRLAGTPPSGAEPKKDQATKDQTRKDQVKKEESPKDESKKDQARKDQGKADEARKDESKKDQARKDQGKADEARKDQGKADEARKDRSDAARPAGSDVLGKIKESADSNQVKLLRLSIDGENSATLALEPYKAWIDRAAGLGCAQISVAADSTGTYEEQMASAVRWVDDLHAYIKQRNYTLQVLLETRRNLSTNGRWLATVLRELRDKHGHADCAALVNFGRLASDPTDLMVQLSGLIGGIVAEFNAFAGAGATARERDIDYARYLGERPCPGGHVTARYLGSEDEPTRIDDALRILRGIYHLEAAGAPRR